MATNEGEDEAPPLRWRELMTLWLESDTLKFFGIVVVLATLWAGRDLINALH